MAMSKHFLPTDHLIISYQELETAWTMMAAPHKQRHIKDTLEAIQDLHNSSGPSKAVLTMVAATAWLMEDGDSSSVG